MKNTIYPLFAYPLMVCARTWEFSEAEQAFITGLETVDNVGNRMSRNDRVLDSDELSGLRRFIDEQVFIYKKNLLHIRDDNEIYITQSWFNQTAPGQYHPKHKHPNSVISGVMFMDENEDRNLPAIRFHRTMDMLPVDFGYDRLNEFNASCRLFEPVQGQLMLFPSLLEHDVEKNTSDSVRTSLSFNTYVRGPVGVREHLTEVFIA